MSLSDMMTMMFEGYEECVELTRSPALAGALVGYVSGFAAAPIELLEEVVLTGGEAGGADGLRSVAGVGGGRYVSVSAEGPCRAAGDV